MVIKISNSPQSAANKNADAENKLLIDLFEILLEWDMKDVKKRKKGSEKVQKNIQYKNS